MCRRAPKSLGDDVAADLCEIATPSSRCRVDGVEVDAAIQDERDVKLISTGSCVSPGPRPTGQDESQTQP